MDFTRSSQNAPLVGYPRGEPMPSDRDEWVEPGMGLNPVSNTFNFLYAVSGVKGLQIGGFHPKKS
jgi:hypothetical protein